MEHKEKTPQWNEISFAESNREVVLAFAKDFFTSLTSEKASSEKMVDCFSIINFLGLPFPIADRVLTCIKEEPSFDFISAREFIQLIELFFMMDKSCKEDFFFQLVDFNKDGSIQLDDVQLFFKHLTFEKDFSSSEKVTQMVDDFFKAKAAMTYTDFKIRNSDNGTLLLFFYSFSFNKKSFNENVLKYYLDNVLINRKENKIKHKTKSSFFKSLPFFNESNSINQILYLDSNKGNNGENNHTEVLTRELARRDQIYRNSFDTTISNNDEDNEDLDINLLNSFEDDKISSFEILKQSPSFPKIMLESNKSCSDTNCANECLSEPVINIKKKTVMSINKKSKPKSKGKVKNQPYPYKFSSASKQKLATQSAMLCLPECLELKGATCSKEPSSLYLEFNNVQNASKANLRLVIVENYLFIFDSEYIFNSKILLLKNSFISTHSDICLTIYPSKEKEYKLTFPNKQKMKQFLIAFNIISTVNTVDQKYEIIEEIARSDYCKINLIRSRKDPKKVFCLKTLYNSNPFPKLSKWEGYIAKYLSINRSNYIIDFYEVYESPKKTEIVMEYFSIKTLSSVINHLTQAQCEEVIKQLTEAVHLLHMDGIIHRDLKLENILYNEKESKIKVIDFGLSKILFPSAITKEFCGTLGYLAPEIIKKEEYHLKVDIWSIGVIAYLLEYKEFSCNVHQLSIEEIYEEICSFLSTLQAEDKVYRSETIIRKIIKATLIKNPNERLTSTELMKLF